jgi:hypothetical protein
MLINETEQRNDILASIDGRLLEKEKSRLGNNYTPYTYYSGDQIEKNEVGGTCSTYGGQGRCIQGLVGKPEEKRPLGKHRLKWEDNIEMYFQEV